MSPRPGLKSYFSRIAKVRLATTYDIQPASVFPLIIDGVLVLALIWRLSEVDVVKAQLVMVVYVLASVVLNFSAHEQFEGGVIAAVAPISLFVSSEICASICKAARTVGVKVSKVPVRDARGRFVKKSED